MDKHELTERLARRSLESREAAADILDDLIYRLWKESREPKPRPKQGKPPAPSKAKGKK